MEQAPIRPRQDVAEIIELVRSQLLGCWRYRWHGLGVAWMLALVGWVTVMLIPDVYSATARIYVDTESALRPLLRGLAVNTDVEDEVRLMSRAILSRPNLEELARDTGMDVGATTPSQMDALIARLQNTIQVESANEILQITYNHPDPALALDVVSKLLASFIEGTLGANRTDTNTAEEFLEGLLREYEFRLNEAEARLAAFKRENVGMMPGEEGDYYSRLQQDMQRLERLDEDLRLARQRRAELQRQMEGEEPVFGISQDSSLEGGQSTDVDAEIARYEEQLANLRLRFTDQHPDVVQVLSVLEGLRAQRERLLAEQPVRDVSSYSALDMNPVYQDMKLQLNAAEIEVQDLTTQRNIQQRRVNDLRQRVDTIPEVEAELKRLTRDYDVTQDQYSQVLQRLEQARLSGAAEESKGDVKFRIIDPPSVSAEPVGPNRQLFVTAVLVLALGGAAAVAFLFNLLRPVFYSASQLERHYSYPVLGVISMASGTGAQPRSLLNAAALGGALAVLLGVYAVVLLFSGMSSQIVERLTQVFGL